MGITVVGQGGLRPAEVRGDRRDVGDQLTPVAGALADPRAQDQLAAFGVDHHLRVVGLAGGSTVCMGSAEFASTISVMAGSSGVVDPSRID
jgi:hypothetical protein